MPVSGVSALSPSRQAGTRQGRQSGRARAARRVRPLERARQAQKVRFSEKRVLSCMGVSSPVM